MDKIFKFLLSAALLLCCIMLNAQQPAGDGSQANPYQIATSDNLVWFADYVNSGNTTACAILTADITMNTNVLDTDGRPNDGPFETWTPIGKPGTDFEGEFNGDGHTISGLYLNNTEENDVGVFGKAINNAYIHDLGVRDSYFYGGSWVGGICGDFASGRIENCWSSATVKAYGNDAGGICGSCWKYASVANCYNIGDVSLYQEKTLDGVIKIKFGGICGTVTYNENATSIDNCYTLKSRAIPLSGEDPYAGLPYVNPDCDKIYGVLDGDAEVHDSYVKDAAAFVGGEVCCCLNRGVTDGNQKWYQTLGSDLSPVMDNSHGTVYYGYHGDVLKYSNTEPDAPAHIVSYVDADGQEQTAVAVEITNETSTLNARWYVVSGNDVQTGPLTCNGAVHLILADGAKLTATGYTYYHTPGIQVSGNGNSLTIYGQTAQSGQLIANGGQFAAGIGGGYEGSGSNITINGGVVTANGDDYAAGIGGGFRGSGSNITINGGTVTANGGQGVSASGQYASAIGGGCYMGENNIFVAATLVVHADNNNPPTTVVADGHTIETDIAGTLGGKRYAIVGAPQGGIVTYGDYITVNPEFASGDHIDVYTEVTFIAADLWAENYGFVGFYKESTFENKITNGVNGRVYSVTVFKDDIAVYAKYKPLSIVPYIDADSQEQSAKAIEITNETTTLDAGWYVVSGPNVQTGTLVCNGAVNLILADGAKLTATGGDNQAGITVSGNGNSLTIYGQTAQTGQLIANGGQNAAGIGGGNGQSGNNITINGGVVTATGGEQSAGIGGGDMGAGSNITINGGIITATGDKNSAGIGGGNMGAGSNIAINGGTVTANGGEHGAGIGGGREGSGSNIAINGGTVTANGGVSAAGIGGGFEQSGYDITINGGEVTANGGENAAGIGRGNGGSASNIKVTAALTVYADNTPNPTTELSHTDNDIAPYIAALRYVIVNDDKTDTKQNAIAEIYAAIEGVTNEDIIAIATNAINAINAATSVDVINAIKEQALAAIASAKAILGDMGVPCDDCPAVEVTKGEKTIKLYNPEGVTFKKTE